MKTLLWSGRCRMYFNAYDEGPKFWSVDNGDSATEVKGTMLRFAGCDFETIVNKASKVQPRAWIEVNSASVWQESDGAEITIESAVQSEASGGKITAMAKRIAA